jgi:SAM-dependent methyltransferase
LRSFIGKYRWRQEDSMAAEMDGQDASAVVEQVRERYAGIALRVQQGAPGCGTGCCGAAGDDMISGGMISGGLYYAAQTGDLPAEAVQASLGCGNPTALIDLHEGETVLDLGSGGGIDVLLSARRVGPTGFVFGLDMTDQMLALARANQEKAGVRNVTFLKGRIEAIPLPANCVDVVISNCVINLSTDKQAVLQEAYRVLRPGGRFAVSDVVQDGPVPAAFRRNMEAWAGCLAGALDTGTYVALLREAGFMDIDIEMTRRYTVAEACLDPTTLPEGWEASDAKLASAFVRATKPIPGMKEAPLP